MNCHDPLANFPNVIYLLSFDYKLVAESLRIALKIDGNAYLEKIVQAPFCLPAIDRGRLREKLDENLTRILEAYPPRYFDKYEFSNIYYEGLDNFIKTPRDILRITNALIVTYPAIYREVNSQDFIVIEFIRVFEPEIYDLVRNNQNMFYGHSDSSYGFDEDRKKDKEFHEGWLSKIRTEGQSFIKKILMQLFPRLEAVWGNMTYSDNFLKDWRRELKICSPDICNVYFQFCDSKDSLRRSDIDELIEAGIDPQKASKILNDAIHITYPNGSTKAQEYLTRLYDFTTEISPQIAAGLLEAIFIVGDKLFSLKKQEELLLPFRYQLTWLVEHLLKKVGKEDSKNLICRLFNNESLCLAIEIVAHIVKQFEKTEQSIRTPWEIIDEQTLNQLKESLVNRFLQLEISQVLALPDLDMFIFHLHNWDKQKIRARFEDIIASDNNLPLLLKKYLHYGTRRSSSNPVARRIYKVNPKHLEDLTDINLLELRVKKMLERSDLTDDQKMAGQLFLKSMDLIRKGKDPKDPFFDDDYDDETD